MKVTFVRPGIMCGVHADALEPLAFAVLAGVTPKHVRYRFYDERIEPVAEMLQIPLEIIYKTYHKMRKQIFKNHLLQILTPPMMI